MDNQETIICAAIHYLELPMMTHHPKNITKGLVVCGYRHPNCVNLMHTLANLRTVKLASDGVGEHIQGFLTNFNRFVDRAEGAKIALAANQIKDFNRFNPDKLYSEDLY